MMGCSLCNIATHDLMSYQIVLYCCCFLSYYTTHIVLYAAHCMLHCKASAIIIR